VMLKMKAKKAKAALQARVEITFFRILTHSNHNFASPHFTLDSQLSSHTHTLTPTTQTY
jgi:hypothetical protein